MPNHVTIGPVPAMRKHIRNSDHSLRSAPYCVDLIVYLPRMFEAEINHKLSNLERRIALTKSAIGHGLIIDRG